MQYLYSPLPAQWNFHNSTARFRLYGGAAGGGKTKALRMEAYRQCKSAPNFRALFLRRTFPELERTVINKFKEEIPPGDFSYHESKHIMRFGNGSTLTFGHCEHEKDVKKFQGSEYDLIAMDELTHFTEFIFKSLLQPLRTTKPRVLPNFIAGTNPGGVGHVWVKRLWIDRDFGPEEMDEQDDYEFFPAKVYDNDYIMKYNIQYVRQLEQLPENLRRALLDGDWDVFEGQYFSEFRREIHVRDPFIPQNVAQRVISMDYGYSAPACALWMARTNDDTYVIYRELYVTQHTYDKLAIKVNAMTPAEEKTGVIEADPAMIRSEKESTTAETVFKKRGLILNAADNDRIGGWDIIRELMHPFQDPNTGNKRSKLIVTTSCPNLIRTLPMMQHDKTRVEDIDTHGEDHALDTARYGLKKLYRGKTTLQSIKETDHKVIEPEDSQNLLTKQF